MQTNFTFTLSTCGPLSQAALDQGFSTFEQLAQFVRLLPYGRVNDTRDRIAVLRERRGTCSTKHQLLATVAHECGHMEVNLTVGIYEMREENTPGVGSVLRSASLTSIPEAHCYLTVDRERLDFTGLPSGVASPFDFLLEEHFVQPSDLPEVKTRLHRNALAAWAVKAGQSDESAWETREACIAALSADRSIERVRTDAPVRATPVER
jgi:hypothetical protein